MRLGEAVVGLLADHYGVDTVFGIPGVHNIELYRGLHRFGVRAVSPRHEQGAGFMADGWSVVTGRPGVCTLISGPGLTNALTPMAQAFHDSRPMLVLAATSERVSLDAAGLGVGHPAWCGWLLRRGWRLEWQAVEALTPVATSQGGRVFYVRSGPRAFLLPQRVAGFEAFLERFSRETGLATDQVGRITPPWTYQLLALLSGALLVAELAWGLSAA